ncbi:MAG TPA: universal stress protein [Rudaea sp.]
MDLLVHIRNHDEASPAIEVAARLARQLDGFLYGLYVAPMGAVTFSTPETVVFQVQEADRLYQEALEKGTWWRAQLERHGLRGESLVAQGEPVEAICHAARWCDLVIAQRPTLNPDAPVGWGTVSRTVFGAGVPVVVVPETAKVSALGERILVAWNHSREAIRAVHGALPLLRAAAEVVVMSGTAQQNIVGARHQPPFDLATYLQRHGVTAEIRPFAAKTDYGAGLLDTAHAMNADLIVMGAWGHSRIASLVLGGTTRYLFQNSDLPLFVSH